MAKVKFDENEFNQFKQNRPSAPPPSTLDQEFEAFKQQGAIPEQVPVPVIPSPPEQAALTQTGPTQGLLENLPIGAIAGGTAAAALSGGLSLLPTLAAVAAGSAAGEGIQQLGELAEQNLPIDLPLISGKNAPKTREEAAKRIATEGALGAAGEGLFRIPAAIARAGKRSVLSPFAKSLTPEEQATAKLLQDENIPYTPFDIQQRVITGRMEKFVEQAFGSGGIMRRFNNRKVQAIKSFADRELEKTGIRETRAQTGRLAQDAITDSLENIDKAASEAFELASREAGISEIIPTTTIKESAQQVREIERLLKVPESRRKGTGILDKDGKEIFKEVKELKASELNFKALESLADDIDKLPPAITFQQARAFQKRLGAKVANLKGLPEGEAKLLFKGFAKAIDQIPNPQALATLDKAKELFKRSIDIQKETSLGKLVGKNPEDVFKTVFKPKNVTDIQALRTVIPASDWNIFQRQFADEIFERAGTDFGKLDTVLKNFSDDTLNAAFDKEQVEFFKKLQTIVKATRLKEISKTLEVRPGVSLINIVRGRMALNVMAGKQKKGVLGRLFTSGTIFLGPATIAKVLTSKGGAKALTTGIGMDVSHPAAAKTIRNIIDIAGGASTRIGLQKGREAISDAATQAQGFLKEQFPQGAQSAIDPIQPTQQNTISNFLRGQ